MYQLYYAPDNASLIVRMVLEELRAEYRCILVDRSSREQDSASYRDLNPKGLIPVCVINGKPVFETAAIILSLAERHRELAPALNDPERPQFLKWLFFLSNSVHTDLRQLFYTDQYSGELPAQSTSHRELAVARLRDSLGILDRHCALQEGDYLMDEELTILDFYLATMLRWFQLFPRDAVCLHGLHDFPALGQLCESVQSLESVQRACTAEGISPPYFDSPHYANPSEGSVT